MPIRMEDDPRDQSDYQEQPGRSSGRRAPAGGGGLMALLPVLLSLFGNRGGGKGGRGKGFLLLLLIGGAVYFVMSRGGGGSAESNPIQQLFSQSGYSFSPEEFKKASVYEGLDAGNTSNGLPEAVSLRKFAPRVMNQGQQGSCVAWSATYAARTIVEAASTKQDPDALAYSPSFVYNQIGLEGCQGSYIQRAMDFMTDRGAVPFRSFPYDETNCTRTPDQSLMQAASQNRMHGFTRLTDGADINGISVRAVKEHLAKDAPVVIGMMVGGSFMDAMMGKERWQPTDDDRNQMGFGGHAMCVIGYDDRRQAFEIMNSWGTSWGKDGFAWVGYADFKEFVREAYGIDPMPKRGVAVNEQLTGSVALMRNDNRAYITLRESGPGQFETSTTVAPGTKFKIELRNNVACYVYVFGQDTNGSSYTLFPYPDAQQPNQSAFSPFCGITGYRLFPRGKSLVPDAEGKADVFAVVVSTKQVDWFALNQQLTQQPGTDYTMRLRSALGLRTDPIWELRNNAMSFVAPGGEESVVAATITVRKP